MESVHGIYDGESAHPSEPVHAKANTPVVITFLDQKRKEELFPRTTVEQVSGCLKYEGPAKSLEEMEEGIRKGAREQMP